MQNKYVKSINLLKHLQNDDVSKIFNLANKNRFNIWIVGGALRDYFLDKKINDIDFVYDINPNELIEILKINELDFIDTYINFGVIILRLNEAKYTLTSLREDYKQDGRYTKVRYIKSIEKDSIRRDLTINALYMDINEKVIDFHDGLKHLKTSKLLFIDDFKKKCLEDNLRIIRFIRFCSLFKFPNYPKEYLNFCYENKELILNIRKRKLDNEVKKALKYKYSSNTLLILKKMNIEIAY